MTPPHRMSVSAYARHRKVSRVAVYKAVTSGRIVREADGSIDAAKADRMWLANTMPRLRASDGEDIVLSAADLERICGG